ncbi:MAG: 50S ribosomal protein L10 [Thermoplasmata archaeon]
MAEAKDHPKAAAVRELADWLAKAKVVGLASIEGIPARQMQQIRARLRGTVGFRIIKNRIFQRALETAATQREGIEGLETFAAGPSALVTTEENPFRLYKELEATKTQAPARGGEVAPDDIVVREGDTPFKPGPVVGDLQKAGVPAAIERGKVVIKKDKVLVEAGQRIRPEVAQVLTRMEILPLTVGLDLRGVFEDGQLYTPENLALDEEGVRRDLEAAAAQAQLLALGVAYPTPQTTVVLLGRAHARAFALALAAEYPGKEVLPRLLSEAHARMTALAHQVPQVMEQPPGGRREPRDAAKAPSEKEEAPDEPATEAENDQDEKGGAENEEAPEASAPSAED